MTPDLFPRRTEHTPAFLLHFVQLSGSPDLLGAEQVTWKISGTGVNIVSGGNGSGKTLLTSAILAATLPRQHESLIHDLRIAGLHNITIVGQVGPSRREWSLDLRSGEVVHRPRLVDDEAAGATPLSKLLIAPARDDARMPHFVVNGEWSAPSEEQIAWAEHMLTVPTEREHAEWGVRLDAFLNGDGTPKPEELKVDIARLDDKIAHGQHVREQARIANEKSAELHMRIRDTTMAIDISSAEEKALVSKIDMAERCLHLENWVQELRSSWSSVESTREQFASLQERLEILQEMTRGVPDNAAELARDYLELQQKRELEAEKLKETEQSLELLNLQRTSVLGELNEVSSIRENESDAEALRNKLADTERELTELSRKRIDLLRRREGFERQRADKFAELSALGPDEWKALENFLESSDGSEMSPARAAEYERKHAELVRITERLSRDFAGFEKLGPETPNRIDKLFVARESVSSREAELSLLRNKAVELQNIGNGAGLKILLTILGAGAAGVPSGLFLGWDIGFFAAVLGGGAGYGIGHTMVPKQEANFDDLKRRIEMLQLQQQMALAERESLRRDLDLFASMPDLDSAQTKWREYIRLIDRKKELEEACALLQTEDRSDNRIPSVLRKLERDDIRRRVSEYKSLIFDLTNATAELGAFDQADGPQARKSELEHVAQQLREQIHDLESRADETKRTRDRREKELSSELARLDAELAKIPNAESERIRLREILESMEALDTEVGNAFSRVGAAEILKAIEERDGLHCELRETKSRLSSEHSPQELATRTSLIEEELIDVTARLQDVDPLFAAIGSRADGLEKYRAQMIELAKQNVEREQSIKDLSTEIEALKLADLMSQVEQLPPDEQLYAERASIQSRLAELENSIRAAQDMRTALAAELTEQREHARARLFAILKAVVFEAVGERFAAVEWRSGEWDVVTEDGQTRPLRTLSRGIAELVLLCLNTGLLAASTEAELAPVFWDDVLSQLDDHHLGIARHLIDQLARDRQVLLFTRDQRIRTWGRPAEVLAGHHEVDVLTN